MRFVVKTQIANLTHANIVSNASTIFPNALKSTESASTLCTNCATFAPFYIMTAPSTDAAEKLYMAVAAEGGTSPNGPASAIYYQPVIGTPGDQICLTDGTLKGTYSLGFTASV